MTRNIPFYWRCPFCPARYTTLTDLRQHMENEHGGTLRGQKQSPQVARQDGRQEREPDNDPEISR